MEKTPLELLEELKKDNYVDGRLPLLYKCRFDIIEKALKDYEELKKEHEQLSKDQDLAALADKSMKALEIIKTKEVDTNVLFATFDWCEKGKEERSLEVYNRNRTDEEFNSTSLTFEEYKLLKEVLK